MSIFYDINMKFSF